jgi:hypothetical protein
VPAQPKAALALSCARCEAALETGDLRCAICGLATPRPPRARTDRAVASVVRCETCRAVVGWAAEAQAPRCAYCGSEMRVEVCEDPVEQAEAFLPFDVPADGARAALKSFLGRKRWLRPSDLASASSLESLKPLWWPAWVCNVRADVSWTADSDAGARRASWAPHAGQTSLLFRNLLISASRGLSDAECAQLTPAYRLDRAIEAPRGPEGAIVEQFDATRSSARRQIVEAVQARAAEAVTASEIPGRRHRKVNVATLLSGLETMRYALPAYVLAYRYRNRSYRVVIHGQDSEVVIGRIPWSAAKIALAIGGGLLAIAATLAAVLLLGQ